MTELYSKFDEIMSTQFSLSNEPQNDTVRNFKRYGKVAKHYATIDKRKQHERDLLVNLTNTVFNYGDSLSSPVCVWTLDHTTMGMSRTIVDSFKKDLDRIDVPNPCSGLMIKSKNCPINNPDFEKVNLFNAFGHEWTRKVADLVSSDKLLLCDLPRYGLIWHDDTGVCDDQTLETIDTLLRLKMVRQNGPSILAVTSCWRGKVPASGGEMTGTRTLLVDSAIQEIGRKNGYKLIRPEKAAIPFQKNTVFTVIYCIVPIGWKDDIDWLDSCIDWLNCNIQEYIDEIYKDKDEFTLMESFIPYIPDGLSKKLKIQEERGEREEKEKNKRFEKNMEILKEKEEIEEKNMPAWKKGDTVLVNMHGLKKWKNYQHCFLKGKIKHMNANNTANVVLDNLGENITANIKRMYTPHTVRVLYYNF